jgi:hypothetical protein
MGTDEFSQLVSSSFLRSFASSPQQSTMFAKVLESPTEQTAFVSLLEEYFQRPPPIAPSNSNSIPSPHHAPTPRSRTVAPTRPAGLVTTSPSTSSPSSIAPAPPPVGAESFSSRMQTAAAGAALRNTTATSSALRQAGLSQGAASSLAGFGAKHHEKLAPHVANAARQGVRMQMQSQQQEEEGPKKPSGLQSGKSMVGVGDTSSGKNVSSI